MCNITPFPWVQNSVSYTEKKAMILDSPMSCLSQREIIYVPSTQLLIRPPPLTVSLGLFIVVAPRSQSDTAQSVGLLWTSDQSDAQHTTLTRDIHVPGGIRTRNPSKQAAEDPRRTAQTLGSAPETHFGLIKLSQD